MTEKRQANKASTAPVWVVGGGAWGTALAEMAARAGHQVSLYMRESALVDIFNRTHENARYLPGFTLSPKIRATNSLNAIAEARFTLLCVPAQASRQTLQNIGAEPLAGMPVLLTAKGFERQTLFTQSQILAQLAPEAIPFVLSGPSFAMDVAAGRPTAVTLAGADPAHTSALAEQLWGPSFRLYASSDILGVEQCGALKNVYALAAGAVEGAELGLSARSALLARAHTEMRRLVVALGGAAETLGGLAGLGDFILSCTTDRSRNYAFGLELGRGRTPAQIEAGGFPLAEGVRTAPVALSLAQKARIEAPLLAAINALLQGQSDIHQIVATLMARPLKREQD